MQRESGEVNIEGEKKRVCKERGERGGGEEREEVNTNGKKRETVKRGEKEEGVKRERGG